MKREVERQAAEINASKAVDMDTVRCLLDWLGEFPDAGEPYRDVAEEVCSWEACKAAIGKFKKGTGVGIDGWSGYLVRKSPEAVQRKYHELLQQIVRTRDFPDEWNQWIAMLSRNCSHHQGKLRPSQNMFEAQTHPTKSI